ncbi:MAG: methylated-DNA--[protein]-cysteine S-methyltransferase [Gaiellaceae bacterium]
MSVTCVSYAADGWGVGEVWHEGGRLVWHELPRPAVEPSLDTRARTRARARVTPSPGGENHPPPSRSTVTAKRARVRDRVVPDVEQLVRAIRRYFEGSRVDFRDTEIEVDGWTEFQRDILAALRSVPYGEIVSYSELARLAGHPRAQRAAGTFCAHNRFPLVVPCHRVVSSNGIGSYGSLGLDYKRRLLALEGVTL